MIPLVWRTVVGGLLLAAVQMIGGAAVFAIAPSLLPPAAPNALPWMLGACVLDVIVLTWLAVRTPLRGWPLGLALGTVLFGVADFTSLIEARFFGILNPATAAAILAMAFVGVSVFVPLYLVLLTPALRPPGSPDRPAEAHLTTWRMIAGSAAYVVVYNIAGMIVFPFVREFYADKRMPSMPELLSFQFFIRGVLFVLLLYVVVRMSAAGRRETALMTAAVMSVIGGVAALMVPNPLLPDSVRWAHFVEVTTSNFVYGWFVGWLLTRPLLRRMASQTATA